MSAETTWVALLRGVNVGGANRLPMAEFRAALAAAGLPGVKTYLQSGNAVFRSGLSAPALADRVADTVLAGFGFRPPVFLLSQPQFQAAVDGNPFAAHADEPTHVHAFFLDRGLPDAGFAFLKALAAPTEAYAVRGKVVWLYLPAGLARSKLANRLAALPVNVTARNLRTVQALADLARGA